MPGSTQTFIAFHATMLKKDKMAVCSFVRTKAAEPRLVALLPQQEEADSFGVQVCHSLHTLCLSHESAVPGGHL